jgi:6,7-dimethyl-8-ribityllumazine synthase
MNQVIEGKLIGDGQRIGIVVSRFNEFITNKLLSGCLDTLVRHNVNQQDIEVIWVPGAFEIPLIAQKMVQRGYDAVICLGAVIRGATPHFEYVSAEVTKGVAQVTLATGVPVVYGIITADTLVISNSFSGTD